MPLPEWLRVRPEAIRAGERTVGLIGRGVRALGRGTRDIGEYYREAGPIRGYGAGLAEYGRTTQEELGKVAARVYGGREAVEEAYPGGVAPITPARAMGEEVPPPTLPEVGAPIVPPTVTEEVPGAAVSPAARAMGEEGLTFIGPSGTIHATERSQQILARQRAGIGPMAFRRRREEATAEAERTRRREEAAEAGRAHELGLEEERTRAALGVAGARREAAGRAVEAGTEAERRKALGGVYTRRTAAHATPEYKALSSADQTKIDERFDWYMENVEPKLDSTKRSERKFLEDNAERIATLRAELSRYGFR